MREARHSKGSFQNGATRWGHRAIAYVITSSGDGMLGVGKDRAALVIEDLLYGREAWNAYL